MDDITKIIKSIKDSDVLIDGNTETVKHEIKKQEGGFLGAVLAPLAASMEQTVISSMVNFKRCHKVWKLSYRSRKMF